MRPTVVSASSTSSGHDTCDSLQHTPAGPLNPIGNGCGSCLCCLCCTCQGRVHLPARTITDSPMAPPPPNPQRPSAPSYPPSDQTTDGVTNGSPDSSAHELLPEPQPDIERRVME